MKDAYSYLPVLRKLFIAFVIFISSCAEPGTFEVSFRWHVTPPAPDTVEMAGFITLPGGGKLLSSPIRAPFKGKPATISFNQVPYDRELTVFVHFYPINQNKPRYIGRSQPFLFKADQNIKIPVDINLVDAPDFIETPTTDIVRITNATNRYTKTPILDIEVDARGVDSFEIAQSLDFDIGYDLITNAQVQDNTYRFTYNLNTTRDDCTPSSCPDGVRKLYIRGLYRGIIGPAVSTTISLDTKPPRINQHSIRYDSSNQNFLDNPRSATGATPPGPTTVVVRLFFDEPVSVRLSSSSVDTSSITFTALGSTGPAETSVEFSVLVDENLHQDGLYTPYVVFEDLAGNEVSTQLATPIVIDSTPNKLNVLQDQVSFVRSPIGNINAEPLADDPNSFVIPAGIPFYELAPSDSLDPATTLPGNTFKLSTDETPSLLRIWADREKQNLLGTARATQSPNISWPRIDLQLVNLDTSQVWVTGLDAAGNESAPTPIHNTWLVGSTATPIEGGRHQIYTGPTPFNPMTPQLPLTAQTSLDGIDTHAHIERAATAWSNRTIRNRPPDITRHTIAYDNARGKAVLFGGNGLGLGFLADTWEWDGVEWNNVTPLVNNPPGRSGHAITYDSTRSKVIIFGGFGAGLGYLSDTWEWDGTTWNDITPNTNNAPAAELTALAYDSKRAKVVLFGGFNGDSATSHTWEFDGKTWTDVTPANSPPALFGHAMTYDSKRGKTVLFGGTTDAGLSSETWQWDGSNWSLVTSSTTTPSARLVHLLTYDSDREKIVMFGGAGSSGYLSDTWEFDGTNWVEITPQSVVPAARSQYAMFYDSIQKKVMMSGGSLTEVPEIIPGDFWAWDGRSWTEVDIQAQNPPGRAGTTIVYNNNSRKIILFGGFDGANYLSDTWEWDGSSWTNITPTTASPPARRDHAMAYDSSRDRIVLFAGADDVDDNEEPNRLSDTWEWDGTSWTQMSPPESPPARTAAAMAYDSKRQKIVLFGGSNLTYQADTWEWDGVSWSDVTPPNGPTFIEAPAMAYDSRREKVVLFSGFGINNDFVAQTWEWDGNSWTNVTPVNSPSPPPREAHKIAFDNIRNKVILFGGYGRDFLSDTWEWDGTSWTDITAETNNPSARLGHGLAFNDSRGKIVLFGGNDGTSFHHETWELQPPTKPTTQFTFNIPANIERNRLKDIRIRASCGADYSNIQSTLGAELLGWVTTNPAGGFRLLGTNTFGSTTPRLISYQPTTSKAKIAQDFFGQRMHFQCRPRVTSEAGLGQIAVDYMEVRIKYSNNPAQ